MPLGTIGKRNRSIKRRTGAKERLKFPWTYNKS